MPRKTSAETKLAKYLCKEFGIDARDCRSLAVFCVAGWVPRVSATAEIFLRDSAGHLYENEIGQVAFKSETFHLSLDKRP